VPLKIHRNVSHRRKYVTISSKSPGAQPHVFTSDCYHESFNPPPYTTLQSYNPLLAKFPHGHKCALVVFAANGGMITLSAACIRTLRRTTNVFELSNSYRSLTNLILFSKQTKKPRYNTIREKTLWIQVGVFMTLIKLIISLAYIIQKLYYGNIINIGVHIQIVHNYLEIFEV
jgi:hypothetical protein